MRKEVIKGDSGQWSWSVTVPDVSPVQRSGYSSYEDANEDAEEEMRYQIRSAAGSAHQRSHQLAKVALATLTPRAIRALAKNVNLADAETVSEIATALESGAFDHGHLDSAGLKSREEILTFIERRHCELS